MTHRAWSLSLVIIPILAAGGGLRAQSAAADPEERVKRLVVLIRDKIGGDEAVGAGILFGTGSDRVYIATANHVVRRGPEEAREIKVQFKWLPGEEFEGSLLRNYDPGLDLAVLSVAGLSRLAISAGVIPFQLLGDAAAVRRGDEVYSLGHPHGQPWVLRVTPDRVAQASAESVVFEGTPYPGHSGGALLNQKREVIGLIRKDTPPNGEALNIARALEKLGEWGYPVRLARRAEKAGVPAAARPEGGQASRSTAPAPVTTADKPQVEVAEIPPKSSPSARAAEPKASGAEVVSGGFRSLALGFRHTCGVQETGDANSFGAAICWGESAQGQLGAGLSELRFRNLSAGTGFTCGVAGTLEAYCWGDGSKGQLGDGVAAHPGAPVQIAGKWMTLSAGSMEVCGLQGDRTAYCWGSLPTPGAEGRAAKFERLAGPPAAVPGSLAFNQMAVGATHACGLTKDREVYCWGFNALGQLGNNSQAHSSRPEPVAGGKKFLNMSVGGRHSCGVSLERAAYCWGYNGAGEVGDGTNVNRNVPVAVAGGLTFATVQAGASHSCGIAAGGAAYCWGSNRVGQLGNGSKADSASPVPVSGQLRFRLIYAGGTHSCGITVSGEAYCWGANNFGQLGDATTTSSAVPVRVTQR